MNQDATYWYEGICPYSGEILRLPRTLQAEAIAKQLMQELAQNVALEGKMYGILLTSSATGESIVLKAFSGLLNGESQVWGWVPPIAGRENVAIAEAIALAKLAAIKQELINLSQIPERLQYANLSQKYESQFQILRDQHQISKQERQQKRALHEANLENSENSESFEDLNRESQLEKMARRNFKRDRDLVLQPLKDVIDTSDRQMQILKKQRRDLSRTLQAQMHSAYVLTNFAGETRSLRELITEGKMPTGMGDCCAPKLLHYAATHRLTPLAMAEFWWGNPSPDGYKIQGEFYGACVERCQPLMGFLLSGRRSPLAPLSKGGKDIQVPLTKGGKDIQAPLTKGGKDIQVPLTEGDLGGSLPIIYEDNDLIAIAKPAGLLSVPGRYLDVQDSVLSRLRQCIQCIDQDDSLYSVHRLDRQTSGILLLARNLESLRSLSHQFQYRQIHKTYEALLSRQIEIEEGTIDLPLWGNPENRPYQQVDWQWGKPSITQFRLLGHEGNYSRIEFMPLTGRTHQLRVHAADPKGLGVTILGDRLYGCQMATHRLHLHARELTFSHPRSQQVITLQIDVPF